MPMRVHIKKKRIHERRACRENKLIEPKEEGFAKGKKGDQYARANFVVVPMMRRTALLKGVWQQPTASGILTLKGKKISYVAQNMNGEGLLQIGSPSLGFAKRQD